MSILADVVRVFTAPDGTLGNELALLRSWPEGEEQRIATELGFSETVFVSSVVGGVATMRIFTPARELPFAGHPSVGAAWWLRDERVHTLRVPAGDVAVRREGDTTWITGRAAWVPAFTEHRFDSPAEVDALDPADFEGGPHYLWAWAGEGRVRSRMFAPVFGIVEDQATGAAAVGLTASLQRDLEITQGLGCLLHTRYLGDDLVEVGGRTVASGAAPVG